MLATFAWLTTGCFISFGGCGDSDFPDWWLENQSDQLLDIAVMREGAGYVHSGTSLFPGQRDRTAGEPSPCDPTPPGSTTYLIKAWAFAVGDGTVRITPEDPGGDEWAANRGKLIGPTRLLLHGERQELVSCATFTYEELDSMDFVIGLYETESPGNQEEDVLAPCPGG